MFYATGLPGWMRFGYSPGWGGMPPGAQYLTQTDQLPQAVDWFQQQASAQTRSVPQPMYQQLPSEPQQFQPPEIPREHEIQMLENQARALEDQVKQIKDRIKQLQE